MIYESVKPIRIGSTVEHAGQRWVIAQRYHNPHNARMRFRYEVISADARPAAMVFCDGSYSTERQRGGWAFAVRCDDIVVCEGSGHVDGKSDAQSMELLAAVTGIEAALSMEPSPEEIYCLTDCTYVRSLIENRWRLEKMTNRPQDDEPRKRLLSFLQAHRCRVARVTSKISPLHRRCDRLAYEVTKHHRGVAGRS